jgi:hypothetical protein
MHSQSVDTYPQMSPLSFIYLSLLIMQTNIYTEYEVKFKNYRVSI